MRIKSELGHKENSLERSIRDLLLYVPRYLKNVKKKIKINSRIDQSKKYDGGCRGLFCE